MDSCNAKGTNTSDINEVYIVVRPGVGVLNTKEAIVWRGNCTEAELFNSAEDAAKAFDKYEGSNVLSNGIVLEKIPYSIYCLKEVIDVKDGFMRSNYDRFTSR